MTAEMGDSAGSLVADRARLEVLRSRLGAHLAAYRQAAGISQPELAGRLGNTRSAISKIEHGQRRMSADMWKVTDELCGAGGVLIAEHKALEQAECDYRGRRRAQLRQARQAAGHAQVEVLRASPAPSLGLAWPDGALRDGQLAEELLHMITKLAQSLGRRDAMHVLGLTLAAIGLADLDPDEHIRVAQAVASPGRLDAQVINNLAITLASCKRQEDKLGPGQVLDTVVAQHRLVHRLLDGGGSAQLRKSLCLVDSNMACSIGWYLIELGHHDTGQRYLEHARKAGHDAGDATGAAYAAIYISNAAFLRRDVPAALDSAAAARSLAARTSDNQIKALAEDQAAAAYALDNQYSLCAAARDRAHSYLANTNDGSVPHSPAYWVRHSTIDTKHSTLLSLLGKPKEALDVATAAHAEFDRSTYVRMFGFCQVRLGHALILSKEITEATRVLGAAAGQANLSARLTQELRDARALMQPWSTMPAVRTLDTQLRAYGLLPTEPGTTTTL